MFLLGFVVIFCLVVFGLHFNSHHESLVHQSYPFVNTSMRMRMKDKWISKKWSIKNGSSMYKSRGLGLR